MNYIFIDLETSGASTAYDSILEVAAILTNDRLETLSTFHRKARLKEGIIPNLGALNVTGFDVNWLKQNPSPHTLLLDMEKQFKEWGVKFHELKLGKPVYDLFIDDKNINSDLFFSYMKNNNYQ